MNIDASDNLPVSWQIVPAKYLFSILNGSTPSSSESAYWNGEIYWATPEDIGSLSDKKLITETRRKISEAGYQNSGTQIAPVGSIVLTTRAPVGNLAIAGVPLTTNQGCKTLVPQHASVNGNYFYYQLIARKTELAMRSSGTTFQELSSTELSSLELWVPPFSYQRAIADYLDDKTAEIDELLTAKQELLTLLAEKRSALITHAVTRGLAEDVPLRDSGVEWLGQVPAHWEVVNLKHLAKIGNGSTPLRENDTYWTNGRYPWLTSTVVNDDVVGEPTQFVTNRALVKCHLPIVQPNSVLVALTGEGKTRGMSALLPYEATINQHLAFATPNEERLESHYLQLYLSGHYEVLRMISEGAGSTRAALTCQQLGEFPIVLPPLDEQKQIVQVTSVLLKSIEELVLSAKETISLLQERRTSLIAAAVTGEVEVTTL